MHAGGLFFFGHIERAVDGPGKLLDIIRVDEKRIEELERGAGKGTENQDAAVVLAGGDKLLGDKIHAVVQRRDQTQRCGTVEPLNFLMRMMPFQKHDWFPAAGLKTRIDTVSFSADFVQKFLVAVDMSAAWSADLHEGESPLISRIQLQKALDTAEALKNPLGVVDAVDSNAEQGRFYPQLLAQCGALRARTALAVRPAARFRGRPR